MRNYLETAGEAMIRKSHGGPSQRTKLMPTCCWILLAAHCIAMSLMSLWNSPTWDEVGHFAAGLYHWETGCFDMYEVNPPLVRVWATLPIHLLFHNDVGWISTRIPGERKETENGRRYFDHYGLAGFFHLSMARCACLPFTVLGAITCFVWAKQLYGDGSGRLSLALWCICPNTLGYGALIAPDLAAASLIVLSAYFFWRWIRDTSFLNGLSFGVAFGFALATKATCFVFLAFWPSIWLIWIIKESKGLRFAGTSGRQLAFSMILSIVVLNGVYAFDGTFKRLGSYSFVSRTLAGDSSTSHSGNRFQSTWLAALTVPLPRNFVQGIDIQKSDFESRMPSYLRGEWRRTGWWYYYVYAMFIKTPVGTLSLLVLSILSRPWFRFHANAECREVGEVVVAAAGILILGFVSSQTGINHHLRYILPAMPFAFIYSSRWASTTTTQAFEKQRNWSACAFLFWAAWSSVSVYPHSLSYFNELVGGPEQGYQHLADSNTDWGQDLLYVRQWVEEKPHAAPVGLVYWCPLIKAKAAGIDVKPVPKTPHPGWYIVSVNALNSYTGEYSYFSEFPHVGKIGYSMNVYHITSVDANRVRRKLGMPRLLTEAPGP